MVGNDGEDQLMRKVKWGVLGFGHGGYCKRSDHTRDAAGGTL